MKKSHAIIAVFDSHQAAESAVRSLSDGGLDIKHFSIIGKGYHKEEQILGFYNVGDRIAAWGGTGAFWGGLWGLFAGGLFMTVPIIGPVVVLGHFAAMVFAAAEGAVVVGGLGALGGALSSLGIPKDSVIEYETALKTDSFLLMAHGSVEEMARAKTLLDSASPARIDLHRDVVEMPELQTERATLEEVN
ncbi:general stress protein [Sphingomonas sp.]|uniref:general stress protein n=1 Tax=Sphingomonas sp. TaxID=28214 RepID=UPI0025FFDB40|nr:general stress protein [Sphingomonas sp.]